MVIRILIVSPEIFQSEATSNLIYLAIYTIVGNCGSSSSIFLTPIYSPCRPQYIQTPSLPRDIFPVQFPMTARTDVHSSLNIREYARTQVLAEDGTTLPLETIQFSDGKLTTNLGGVRIPHLPNSPFRTPDTSIGFSSTEHHCLPDNERGYCPGPAKANGS